MQITTQQLNQFDAIVQDMIAVWAKVKPVSSSYLGIDKGVLGKGLETVINGVDKLVNFAATLDVPGSDKKAAVLGAANTLFDGVIGPELPMWAKPFNSILKTVMDSVLDKLIEYIVSKVLPQTPVAPAKA